MKDLKILSSKLQKELEQIQSSLFSSEASENHFHTVHILRSELLPFLTKNNEAKRFTKEITLYKKQLREATKKMEGDLKEVTISTKIDGNKVREIIDSFLSCENSEAFFRKVAWSFCPKKDETKANSMKNQSVFLSLASLTIIDDKGNPKRPIAHDEYSYKQYYQTQQGLFSNHLNIIFVEAIAKGLIDFEKTREFIESQLLLRTDSEVLSFRRGLERLFVGDFVSALHILVPLYERVIINISEMLWIDIIAMFQKSKETSTQDKTIGTNFVTSEAFVAKWWKDFAEQINFILFDDYGYKLRHQIAHGEMNYTECNSTTGFLILYLYVAIAGKITINRTT